VRPPAEGPRPHERRNDLTQHANVAPGAFARCRQHADLRYSDRPPTDIRDAQTLNGDRSSTLADIERMRRI
jgi:hypothetical protein